jgi:hypothetical protein
MSELKKAIEYYKTLKREEKEKQRLINAKTNFILLENLIQKCNENDKLKITVYLKDGTRLELQTMQEKKRSTPKFDGVEYVEIQ